LPALMIGGHSTEQQSYAGKMASGRRRSRLGSRAARIEAPPPASISRSPDITQPREQTQAAAPDQ